MTRSLFFVCVAALACMVSAAPQTSDVASSTIASAAPATSIMSGGGYDTHGLPSSIFPNYSGIVYHDTDELNDGQQYLEDQNAGKLPE